MMVPIAYAFLQKELYTEFFIPPATKTLEINLKINIIIYATILVTAIASLLFRFRNGTLWFLRIYRGPLTGGLWLVNTTALFSLFSIIFTGLAIIDM